MTPRRGRAAIEAATLLEEHGFEAEAFDWEQRFQSSQRGDVAIPAEITDPAEFSVEQLKWLREGGVV